jgi:hypothetical protein
MSQNNHVRRLVVLTGIAASIHSAYKATSEDSDFWISFVALSFTLIVYMTDEFIDPERIRRMFPPLKRIIKYISVRALILFLGYLSYIYLPILIDKITADNIVADTVEENKDNSVARPPPKESVAQERPAQDPVQKKTKTTPTKRKPPSPKTWNQLVNRNKLCNASPLQVIDTRHLKPEEARQFLSRIPQIKEYLRITNSKKHGYLYHCKSFRIETWNSKRETYYRNLGKTSGGLENYEIYNRQTSANVENVKRWVDEWLTGHILDTEKRNYMFHEFDVNCPRIVLYHEYDVPNESKHAWDRFKTFKRYEIHVYWFRDSALFDKGKSSV